VLAVKVSCARVCTNTSVKKLHKYIEMYLDCESPAFANTLLINTGLQMKKMAVLVLPFTSKFWSWLLSKETQPSIPPGLSKSSTGLCGWG